MNSFEELKHLPRFTIGSIKLKDLIFNYNDPLAFYNEYNDVFVNEIYRFNSSIPSPLILDVGGYIGLTVMYFKTLFPQAEITVFEPDPTIFGLLKKNISGGGYRKVTMVKAGVGKEKRKLSFYPSGSDGGNFYHRVQGSPVEVEILKLSDFINQPIDLLKINIEGMEGDVFEEIEYKLPFVKEIIFEYHAFYSLPQCLGKILTILDRNHFRYIIADVPCARTPVPFQIGMNYKYFNLVYATKISG